MSLQEKLTEYILACQDEETGGFSDRPGDMVSLRIHSSFMVCSFSQVDPYHTLFGLAGLSLLGDVRIKPINPVYCLPHYLIEKLKCVPKLIH